MDLVKKVWNNRWLGIAGVTVLTVFEHFQTMSIMKMAPEDGWNDDNEDYFDDLQEIALVFEDSTYLRMFWSLSILSIVFSILFTVFYTLYQKYNVGYWLMEYVMFGFLFMPTVVNVAHSVYCDPNLELYVANDVTCFEEDHYEMVLFGFIGLGAAVVMAAAVFPVLKSDRDGVEARWENEAQFESLHKLLNVGIVLILAPIALPWVGIFLHCLLIAFLMVYEGYKDLWVASIKMGVLWAQLWVFICAEEIENDEDTGNDMLWGWVAFLAVGYIILPAKSLIFKREETMLASQRPTQKI